MRFAIRFQILYVFLVLAHERRRIVHFAVTAQPTAEWAAHQLREAFPWESVPQYLLRDRDRIFGHEFVEQVKAMGIEQVLSTPRSPWQRARHGLIWHCRKIVLNRAKYNHPMPARLSRFRRSAVFIIVTSAGLPEELPIEKMIRVEIRINFLNPTRGSH